MNNALFQAVCEILKVESREDLMEKIKTTSPMQAMDRPDAHAVLRLLRLLAEQWPENLNKIQMMGRRCEERLHLNGDRFQCLRQMGHHEPHDFA